MREKRQTWHLSHCDGASDNSKGVSSIAERWQFVDESVRQLVDACWVG